MMIDIESNELIRRITKMDKEMEVTTTSVSAMSGIPWKKVRKLVNDGIAAGANVDISCDADGSWSIAIYPPEKKTTVTVPSDDGINTIPSYTARSPYVAPVDAIKITCNTGESNG